MRRIRTNNEIKLRVLKYRCFTVYEYFFLKFSVSKNLFVLIFILVSFYFAGNLPKLNAEILSEKMQKRPPTELMTVRRACDGP